jgi:hypothetical protein
MKPAPAVEPLTAVKATATVESTVTAEPAAMKPAVAAEPMAAPATVKSASEAAPVVAPSVVAVIPRAGADKQAADEPIWAVEAVRRTSIGVIIVVAVSAYRRRAIVTGANADHHSLRIRE